MCICARVSECESERVRERAKGPESFQHITLQHTATHTATHTHTTRLSGYTPLYSCNTLQRTAPHSPHCNTLQLTCPIRPHPTIQLQHTATQCNTVQHTVTHCNTLQHTATHCNTLQHTTTHLNRPVQYGHSPVYQRLTHVRPHLLTHTCTHTHTHTYTPSLTDNHNANLYEQT